MATMGEATARLTASPIALLRQAAGSPREMAAKVRRLARALAQYANAPALDARLTRLRELGYLERVPTRLQLVVGSIDMLRFWISPAAADYYAQKGIDYGFHQVLRFLDDPASMVDPTGFLSTRDNIIGHLMQVVHANPAYDLQLLESHERGLEELEAQVEQMIAGTHPRASSIGAVVEEPDYHARLLAFVREYRAHRDADAPIRDNVASDPRWREVERTFGTLPRAMAYFAKLPDTPLAAARHLVTVRSFPRHLAPLD
ncbi:MAG: hypothetical protein M5U28_44765 [Sandaracinaceae bacterium]|nr:hypothetical protein [Sandaracinaceae bacterium]